MPLPGLPWDEAIRVMVRVYGWDLGLEEAEVGSEPFQPMRGRLGLADHPSRCRTGRRIDRT